MKNLKIKVDVLDVVKLTTVPTDLKKLSDIVSKEIVKNIKFKKLNMKVNSLENKTHIATTLIHINQYKANEKSLKKNMEIMIKNTWR